MQEEFRRCSRFGLGSALDMIPIMSCDSNDAPNFYQDVSTLPYLNYVHLIIY